MTLKNASAAYLVGQFLPFTVRVMLSLRWILLLITGMCPIALASENIKTSQPAASMEARNILFSHITPRDGLSQQSVIAITQDQQGFIWFGTQEGLNRYDGKEIKVYEHDHNNPNSLSHDWVWSLLADNQGALWIGTDGGGLNRFEPQKKIFTHFMHDANDPNSISGDRIRVVYKDRQGILWIGTDSAGLNRFDPEKGEFVRFSHDPDDPDSLSDNRVLTIVEDRHGALWIGTRGGLERLDVDTGKFTHFRHQSDDQTSLSNDQVRAIYEDNSGALWVGTYEGGLNLYHRPTGTFTRFKNNINDPYSLSNNKVMSIYQDTSGTLWIATDNGLNEWRQNQQGFVRYHYDIADPSSLSNDRITAVFQDNGGVLWIGTSSGVNKWNYVSESFNYYQENSNKFKLSSNIITAIAEGEGDVVWIGTYGGGLNKLNFDSGETTYYRKQTSDRPGLNDERVMAAFVDQQKILWLGTRSGGLNRFDPITQQFTYFKHDPKDQHSLSSNGITSIYGDTNGLMWVGTYGGGLNLFDTKSAKFTVYRHDPKDKTSISSDRIMAIYRDKSGVLWLGTEDGGLNRFDANTQHFTRYQHDPDNQHSLANNSTGAILEGSDGSLWIGSQSGGLNRWSSADRQAGIVNFTKYHKSDGLISDKIMAILEDDQGKIWLSTFRGLSRLDPNSGAVSHFSRDNGLRGNDFMYGAALVSQKGSLLFGSIKGVVSFVPKQMKLNTHLPPVVLSAHTRNGELATTYSSEQPNKIVELEYKDQLIFFEFAGLDFAAPQKNLYRYKLEGFDDNWSDPVKFQRTTYTNLPTGQYTFKVMAANNDGIWNNQHATFTFEILSPLWKNNWAYALYVLILTSAVLTNLRTHTRKRQLEKCQREQLELQVELRTQELAERNKQLLHLNNTLEKLSVTDALTGLKNRRYLQDYMKSEVGKIQRWASKYNNVTDKDKAQDVFPGICLMMIDLDGFKAINDTYGHNAGDKVLIQVRDLLQECFRKNDIICRWGGDEFLILCSDARHNVVEQLAERIRKKIAGHCFLLGQGNVGLISGSIGFAKYPFSLRQPDLIGWEQVTIIADRAAYLSKQNGRNAWAGIYSSPDISLQECAQISSQLQHLLAHQRISLKTSFRTKLVFDTVTTRQGVQ